MRVLAVCGSLQAKSSNLALLERAKELAPSGVTIAIFDGLRDLPLFNPDYEAEPERDVVTKWRRAIAESDALLVACPEYGYSLPGALKNAIDWVIGTGELERKVVAITAATNHAERGRGGLAALTQTLTAVKATIVGGAPTVRGSDFDRDLAKLVADLADAVRARQAEE